MAELPKDMIFHYHSDDGITVKVYAIPLVRCRECKWSRSCGYISTRSYKEWKDWFCADGEREVQE